MVINHLLTGMILQVFFSSEPPIQATFVFLKIKLHEGIEHWFYLILIVRN